MGGEGFLGVLHVLGGVEILVGVKEGGGYEG
jgi:hypothetical protein